MQSPGKPRELAASVVVVVVVVVVALAAVDNVDVVVSMFVSTMVSSFVLVAADAFPVFHLVFFLLTVSFGLY